MPILPSQSWSRFDWDCCDSSIPSWYYPHTSQPVLFQIWPRRLWFYITAGSMPILLTQSWSRFDRDRCDSSIPYCYYPHTSLSHSWSRFDRRCCDSSIPAGSMPILPSQFWSRFHRDSPNLAYSLVVCQYLSPSLDPDLTETAVILAYLLILSSCLAASFDPDLTDAAAIQAYCYYPHTSQPVCIQIWPTLLRFMHTDTILIYLSASLDPGLTEDVVFPAYLLDTIPIPLSQFWSRFDRDGCDST